jgi:hypothetical protein
MHIRSYVRLGLVAVGGWAVMAAAPAFAFSCTPMINASTSPYSQSKYQSVIDNSEQLQVQSTATCLSRADMQAKKIDSDNWHLDGDNMWFGFTGGNVSDRVELRGTSFSGSSTGKTWSGKVKIQYGGSYSTGFTIGQIFGESTQDPILRLEFIASRSGVSNHVWAIYRTGTGSATVQYYDLGAATSSSYTPVTMEYGTNNSIQVTYNGTSHSFTDNFSYWDNSSKKVYFKAGCYLQNAGSCAVTYSSLRFDK